MHRNVTSNDLESNVEAVELNWSAPFVDAIRGYASNLYTYLVGALQFQKAFLVLD